MMVRSPGFEPGSSALRPFMRVGRLTSFQARLQPLRNVSMAVLHLSLFVKMSVSMTFKSLVWDKPYYKLQTVTED